MANPRVFALLSKFVPQIKTACAPADKATPHPKRFYRTVVNILGAQNPTTTGANHPQKMSNTSKRIKSGYVSTLYRRYSRSANQKQMMTTESVPLKRKSATRPKKSSHEKPEMTSMANYESANHALVLARLNNYKFEHMPGSLVKNEVRTNIGVFLKDYQSKGSVGPTTSFADHVKQAQRRLVRFPGSTMDSTQKMAASTKAQQERARARKVVSSGLSTNVSKLLHPPSNKSTTTVASVSTDAYKSPRGLRHVPPLVSNQRSVFLGHYQPKADHRKMAAKEAQSHSLKYTSWRPISAVARLQYQPSKLPTMKTLMKTYKDQDHDQMMLLRHQNLRNPRADDGKNLCKRRQLPVINMSEKCPMDEFVAKKSRNQFGVFDTAHAFRQTKAV